MNKSTVLHITQEDLDSIVTLPNRKGYYLLRDLIKAPRRVYPKTKKGSRNKILAIYKYAIETGKWRNGTPADVNYAKSKYEELSNV